MRKIAAFVFLLWVIGTLSAQTILLERDINESVYNKKKGPNKTHFFHLYINSEPYLSKGKNGFQAEGLTSYREFVGGRNYYRLANNYIMGFDVEFGREVFRLMQNSQKTFPAVGTHKKELLYSFNIGLRYFNRLLITQRQNSLGVWLDLGAYTNYTCGTRHFIRDKASASENARVVETTAKGLKYVERMDYGLNAKLGFKRYAITGTYRFSDWFTPSVGDIEPPRASIGLELGIY